jgi:hypothetical protein
MQPDAKIAARHSVGAWFLLCTRCTFNHRTTEGKLSTLGRYNMPRLNFLLRYATLLGVFGALQFSNCAKAADLNALATAALKPFFEQLIAFF